MKEAWYENVGDDDDIGGGTWVHCALEVPVAKLQKLLWCAVVIDFASMRLNPACRMCLVNPKQGLVVHPYDDRVMDVIRQNACALKALYHTHNAWLLDHDRAAMDECFKPG